MKTRVRTVEGERLALRAWELELRRALGVPDYLEVKVRCSGRLHRVIYTHGKLVFPDHDPACEVAAELVDGQPSRCREILEAWRAPGELSERLPKRLARIRRLLQQIQAERQRLRREQPQLADLLLWETTEEKESKPPEAARALPYTARVIQKWLARYGINSRMVKIYFDYRQSHDYLPADKNLILYPFNILPPLSPAAGLYCCSTRSWYLQALNPALPGPLLGRLLLIGPVRPCKAKAETETETETETEKERDGDERDGNEPKPSPKLFTGRVTWLEFVRLRPGLKLNSAIATIRHEAKAPDGWRAEVEVEVEVEVETAT